MARFDEDIVRQAVEYIDFLEFGILGRADDVGVKRVKIVDELAVEAENLGRAVDYRSERIQYPLVGQCLDYDLISYSVAVTLGDADSNFIVYHRMCFYNSFKFKENPRKINPGGNKSLTFIIETTALPYFQPRMRHQEEALLHVLQQRLPH